MRRHANRLPVLTLLWLAGGAAIALIGKAGFDE
jgi:hypothetical protein